MENEPIPRIVEANRMKDGVLITFEDGRFAIYSTELLHASYDLAKRMMSDIDDIESLAEGPSLPPS